MTRRAEALKRHLNPDMRPLWLFVAGTTILSFLYFAFPEKHFLLWTPLGVSSAVATVVGVVRHRPGYASPWFFIAAALACFITGDTVYNVLTDVLGWENPFPSITDVFYVAMYPLIAAGLILFIRSQSISRNGAALIDALIVTTGFGLLSWVYLILPYFQAPDLGALEKAVSAAYPLGDVLVLAMLARLLAGGRRLRSIQLLAVGGGGLLAADVLYGWIQLNGEWKVGGPVDVGWVVFYIAWGSAALHPSMRKVHEPAPTVHRPLRLGHIALLAVISLIAPAVLMTNAVERRSGVVGTVAVFSAILYLLVITRLWGIVAVHRQSVLRERTLRSAWEALVSAQDPRQIHAAAITAVQSLAGAADLRVALYGVDDGIRLIAGTHCAHLQDIERWAGTDAETGAIDLGRVHVSPLRYDANRQGLLVVRSATSLSWEVHGALQTLASQVTLTLESLRLAADLRRRQRDEHFKRLIQQASDIILVVDAYGAVSYGSPSVERRLGWPAESVIGNRFESLLHPEDVPLVARVLQRVSDLPADSTPVTDWRLRHRDGSYRSFEVIFSDLSDDPLVAGVVLTMRDVSDRRELERQLAYQAYHDGLTGLPNRSLFHDRAQHALTMAKTRGTRVAMLMIDLDQFKLVNDRLGHSAGDEFLAEVAKRLRNAFRTEDTVARLAGDEFAALIEDVADSESVLQDAQRVLTMISEPLSVMGEIMRPGASAGLVITGDGDRDATLHDLLRHADIALYAAKERGRGIVVPYHDDLSLRMQERVRTAGELRKAIDSEQLMLMYQPIVAIETGELIGVEALTRWMHPERGLLGPQEFIPLAEETGLINDLGGWVLQQTCRQAGHWSSLASLRMSVNVSPRQLEQRTFIDEVAASVAANHLPPGMLVLELTESVLVRDDLDILERLNQLRAQGALIAIDDFGVGFSSLGYLHRFPVDLLKIDKSFVDILGSAGGRSGALARAIVSLGHALRLQVVAEGVELAEQRDELWSIGCELAQGYLYAPPMRAEEVEELLISGASLGPPGPRTGGSHLSAVTATLPRQVSKSEVKR